ncbi:MBL fold metallo-hydrolase [Croceitalea sp. MTPC9]|uniref:MBL fold metallo-hydrolase n=1 Tax=unclassified Croceitalea TaxID=2632280 RepID=UPI002B3725F2|nr:MBL fold metallo-hydrolase [Croceitalea sp. MTPC6]GMN15709.1 MBL fold metallo-hydrolase [Croceitalea sp. MTPC9]
MFWTVLAIVGLLVILYFLFVNFYPSFGGDISKEQQLEFAKSDNYRNGQFVNKKDVPKDLSFGETLSLTRKFFFTKVPNGSPSEDIEVQKVDSTEVANYKSDTRLIWFGHSSFLLQIDGKNILIDPMFGKVAAPHNLLGTNRFNKEMPIVIEKLPKIDLVLISHDHYDHLDYPSIKKLKDKVGMFYAPLGVGSHLKAWGVGKEKIIEFDWWEERLFKNLKLACTPAQHFSGRKFNNRQSTLWSSWVIKSETESLFFSGDSGYAPHFKEIGEIYGPFNFAMLECGQYNKMWADIHMFPEETAQAGLDLNAKLTMPIHWGAFKLALHDWIEPVKRFKSKAEELGLNYITPQIGQEIIIGEVTAKPSNWWNQ